MKKLILAILMVLLLPACALAGLTQSREAFIAKYPLLSDQTKADIRAGMFRIGMHEFEIQASMGIRERAGYWVESKGAGPSGTYEVWKIAGYMLYFNNDILTSFSEYPPRQELSPIITISFPHSSSSRFSFALAEAKKNPSFRESERMYAIDFNDAVALHRLLDHLKSQRNRHVYVDGTEIAWDEVFHYLPCYGLRTKAYDPEAYCHGDARQYPAFNPWGCIQVCMPLSVHTEWLLYGKFDADGTWIFDKKKIAHYLKANTHQYRFCPALNMDYIMRILWAFPETANPRIDRDWQYSTPLNKEPAVKIRIGDELIHACGVKPSSPIVISKICEKIYARLASCPADPSIK